jgi:hypothetical protein
MSDIIFAPATIIATLTFFWYRKGRLWNFYDSLISKSLQQIETNSLDRKHWERLALEQCSMLSQELFNSLFRFEIEYLRDKIMQTQYSRWIPDSEENNDVQITYTDKEKYCKYILMQTFFSDFRFCGIGLFLNAVQYRIIVKNDSDPGYVETRKGK